MNDYPCEKFDLKKVMAATRSRRPQVGSTLWIEEEENAVAHIGETEVEEFEFSAFNELEWLNEHMAEIFFQDQVDVAEMFKTPGNLRGKTPRTPLSDVFLKTLKDAQSPTKQDLHFKSVEEVSEAEESHNILTFQKQMISPKLIINGISKKALENTSKGDSQENLKHFQLRSPSLQQTEVDGSYNFLTENDENDENVIILGRDSDNLTPSYRQQLPSKQDQVDTGNTSHGMDMIDLEDLVKTSSQKIERPFYPEIKRMGSMKQYNQIPPLQKTPNSSPGKKSSHRLLSPVERDISIHGRKEIGIKTVEGNSQSEGSSPLRPMVRKSSLNFASLPAREPITKKKSISNQTIRASQQDISRKSLQRNQTDEIFVESGMKENNLCGEEYEWPEPDKSRTINPEINLMHQGGENSSHSPQNQIIKFGKFQKDPQLSKSAAYYPMVQTCLDPTNHSDSIELVNEMNNATPMNKSITPVETYKSKDNDKNTVIVTTTAQVLESSSLDIYDNISTSVCIAQKENVIEKSTSCYPTLESALLSPSPNRESSHLNSTNTTPSNRIKSVSTSALPVNAEEQCPQINQKISVWNPNLNHLASLHEDRCSTTSGSLPRSFHGSPFKAAKDKVSSLYKSSKALFAGGPVPSPEFREGIPFSVPGQSETVEKQVFEFNNQKSSEPQLSLSDLPSENKKNDSTHQSFHSIVSHSPQKSKTPSQRVESNLIDERDSSSNDIRGEESTFKDTEEANKSQHVQDKIVAAERASSKFINERNWNTQHDETSCVSRMSPNKAKEIVDDEISSVLDYSEPILSKDIEIIDAPSAIAQTTQPRPKSKIGRSNTKRPLKPAKELIRPKPPTVIRVDTGSQRGNSYHPSNATLSATLQDSFTQMNAVPNTKRHKASTSSVQSKSSSSNFKPTTNKNSEAIDKLAASRRREAKMEVEQQRFAINDTDCNNLERQLVKETEIQRENPTVIEKTAGVMEPKKAASRQATEKRRIENDRVKQIQHPVSHARMKIGANLEKFPPENGSLNSGSSKPILSVQNSSEIIRPGSFRNNPNKVPPKRPLAQDSDLHHINPSIYPHRTSHQGIEHTVKRHKTGEFDDDKNRLKMTAPPIRQSSIRQKEIATKSLYTNGYTNSMQSTNLQRSTTTNQHSSNQIKPSNPIDMTQIFKGPIQFATPSTQASLQSHKTPARAANLNNSNKLVIKTVGKTAAKTSPRYPNGETIDLPEILTDSENEESEEETMRIRPGWTDTAEIQRQLALQESIDPAQVFGQPGPLNMEEVFCKSKERFHKFRARTSSANWSGTDKLTEDEIQRDLEGRERLRRQGGWTYDAIV
ncbi:inner centromere protein [Blumeria hordei DH14]|uniref:Inner centromere protein n=1 Tax=Blumeria graminis f. sp. hordei (strain DH14) TaxID=546991 RepID=N1JJ24_BLUG1|nr:inner centromere protein [Blumeria hordei DH14]